MNETLLSAALNMALTAALCGAYFESLDRREHDLLQPPRRKRKEDEVHEALCVLYAIEILLHLMEGLQHVHVYLT
jgi:hypothetical protein